MSYDLSKTLVSLDSPSFLPIISGSKKNENWNLAYASTIVPRMIENLENIQDKHKQISKEKICLLRKVMADFESEHKDVSSLYAKLGKQTILHGDLSTGNILVKTLIEEDDNELYYGKKTMPILAIIDWQDIQIGPRAVEFAFLALYLTLDYFSARKSNLEEALRLVPKWLVAGYTINGRRNALSLLELDALPVSFLLTILLR